jgi:hypothetical protein
MSTLKFRVVLAWAVIAARNAAANGTNLDGGGVRFIVFLGFRLCAVSVANFPPNRPLFLADLAIRTRLV